MVVLNYKQSKKLLKELEKPVDSKFISSCKSVGNLFDKNKQNNNMQNVFMKFPLGCDILIKNYNGEDVYTKVYGYEELCGKMYLLTDPVGKISYDMIDILQKENKNEHN